MSSFYRSYIGISSEEREIMLKEMDMKSTKDLFSDIPDRLLLEEPIDLPGPFSEIELTRLFEKIAEKNIITNLNFSGGGVKPQYIPAAIEELMRRGELYTSYTPYQPEISQGLLQLVYEYQSMLAELLQMDVVNASMYDWGSALGEAILISKRITKKSRFLIAQPISPQRLEVAKAYTKHANLDLELIPEKNGKADVDKLIRIFNKDGELEKKDRQISGVYLEIPSYYGTLIDYPDKLSTSIHSSDALFVVGVDPISLGLISPPGEYGADLVIGEGQLLGNALSSGGPLLGILAINYNRKWLREVPGRLIGSTNEMNSDLRGFCITLQTREQHIRREKATSNICTNQSIAAVNAAIYMASLGKNGIIELGRTLYDRAHYLADKLDEVKGVTAPKYSPFFTEFLIELNGITNEYFEERCLAQNVIPGIRIDAETTLRLISVNENQDKHDLDRFVQVVKEVMES